ncbi:hypothetical protein [Haloferula sp. A504]|uniref:hypothetical protein n=1 Tax=Haloferula sp. A504 TaxID=3373601 RepID=UPI0037BEBC6B
MTGRLGWLMLVLAIQAPAIPNAVFGPVARSDSPLNGEDLTGPVLAALQGGPELPGEWAPEAGVGAAEISHLLARPALFGREVVILRAVRREGALERVEATFADAGSFFGYFDQKLPEGLSRRQQEEELRRRMAVRQEEFATLYDQALATVRAGVAARAGEERPKSGRVGKGRVLRAEVDEWECGDLTLRLFSADQRLVRLVIGKDLPDGWLDPAFEDEDDRERATRLASAVRKDGEAVRIEGLEPIPQGYRPYCGLNSLAMVARHLGLHLDEDWMAAAAGFRNTGSAAGSNMVRLYQAVAAEAGLGMDRSSRFDEFAVRGALAEGRPVIVWRRFSHERNRLHDRVAAGRAELPDPASAEERASWPGEEAPLHASVLTGFDGARNEVFFLESWTGRDRPRRMRFEEMAATAYLTFVFED